jgi:hypothetical protein
LIRKFHSALSGGKYASRSFYLAYAFLKEVPYVVLEKKINEDNFPTEPGWDKLKCGMFSVLYSLAHGAAWIILKMDAADNPDNWFNTKGEGDVRPLCDDIYQWMLVKYQDEDKAELKEAV